MTGDAGAAFSRFGCGWIRIKGQGEIEEVNDVVSNWLGNHVVGTDITQHCTPGSAAYWHTAVVPYIHTDSDVRDIALVLREGSKRHHVLCTLIADSGGHTIMLVPNTERKKFEEQQETLEEQRQQEEILHAAKRIRTAFVNEAAHQLATPVTPAILHVAVLRKEIAGTPKLEKSVDAVAVALGKIQDFIKQIQAMEVVLDIEEATGPIDLERMAQDAIDHFDKADIQLEVKDGEPVRGQSEKSHQAIQEIIGNAVKFGEGNTIQVWVQGSKGVVRVIDNGIGMDPGDLIQIGELFVQVFDPKKITALGMGMGLYIAKAAMEAQGGSFQVDSPGLDKGTTVTLTWPVSDA